jgi:hypothetical protein
LRVYLPSEGKNPLDGVVYSSVSVAKLLAAGNYPYSLRAITVVYEKTKFFPYI